MSIDHVLVNDRRKGDFRKAPAQQRSKDRIETILRSAEDLIEAGDPKAFTTRALSAAAGVPVGSIYQSFSTLEAIVEFLVLRRQAAFREHLVQVIGGATDVSSLQAMLPTLINAWRVHIAQSRVYGRMLSGPGSIDTFVDLDLNESHQVAQLATTMLRHLFAKQDEHIVSSAAFFLCDMIGAAARTATRLEADKAEMHLEHLTKMCGAFLRSLADEDQG
ncbi:TetR/AcrR family transcriptional regulator [uncultured Erythrobacter sp.]|uniref:TetR/AcrR family transcriptional regulator n=1 Tax=uncultured Erythrobacter sp. TaxID=263913 RepID=UPI00265B490F|nr:TetR/AcrR family transcriptional regulator [uncultured Erythrobacter sp.]